MGLLNGKPDRDKRTKDIPDLFGRGGNADPKKDRNSAEDAKTKAEKMKRADTKSAQRAARARRKYKD